MIKCAASLHGHVSTLLPYVHCDCESSVRPSMLGFGVFSVTSTRLLVLSHNCFPFLCSLSLNRSGHCCTPCASFPASSPALYRNCASPHIPLYQQPTLMYMPQSCSQLTSCLHSLPAEMVAHEENVSQRQIRQIRPPQGAKIEFAVKS